MWEGPYTIFEVGDYGSFTIKDDKENYDIVHGDKLKPYHDSSPMIPEVFSTKLQHTLRKFRQFFLLGMIYIVRSRFEFRVKSPPPKILFFPY
ncbi:hypothetical protein AYI69_g10027 [Smittium culicis]|uniref:Uncharacterized protein n=1 Tax=Smittium culicis TaxID=133412 RepID=A0A1R1X8P4_9FUNG|nr:hypothetical protein AYI69_g10027 [Smittium culicis]